MAERGFTVKALGEIAIRCRDLDEMVTFYRDVIGLDVLDGGHRDGIVFFKICAGHGGHTCVLALFNLEDDFKPAPAAGSSLHHLALTVERSEQDRAIEWYQQLGLDYRVELFDWIGWRGVFTEDPEGNTVELVAYNRDT
ncbi:MAG: VOC family protein [Aestuariivirgaceae bacterium]